MSAMEKLKAGSCPLGCLHGLWELRDDTVERPREGCPGREGPTVMTANHWCQDSGQRVAQTAVSGPLARALVVQGLEPSVAPTNW